MVRSIHCLYTIPCVIVVAVLPIGAVSRAAERTQKNVLFIVSDDLNNHLGCYGHDVKTPAIDALARRGMRFDRAYCQVPVCNPSRVSFLSGLRPDRTQVYTLTTPTREHLGDWIMLPEYFRKNGYFTAGIGKVYHTDVGFEDPRSWDVEIREFGKRPPLEQIATSGEPDGPGEHTIDWASLNAPDEETPDGIVARKAVEVMKQAVHEHRPFFIGVGFRRPHAPFAAPKKYFDLYPPDRIRLPDAPPVGHFSNLLPPAQNYEPSQKPLTPKEQREIIAAYYACSTFVDAQVDVLLTAVDQLDLWESTVIVFFGDHGYHLGEHGGLWHKMSLFEESTRAPLIIYAPGMRAPGRACEQIVELLDLYPTLVKHCGLPTRAGLDGVDLSALLDDPSRPVKKAAYSLTTRDDSPQPNHEKVMSYLGRSVRTDRWRYTEWDGGKRGAELYDHLQDPHEWHNLADQPDQADTIRELKQMLLAEQPSAPSP